MVSAYSLAMLLAAVTATAAYPVPADIYQTPEAFLRDAFTGPPPAPSRIWIRDDTARSARAILGHDMGVLRVVYWGEGTRTAWVLDEIGKEQPITAGIVIDAGRIETVRVLEYRETRGAEVRHAFFTDQFRGAALSGGDRLDRDIDGISGATLSVGALTRLARLALMLHARTPFAPGAAPE